MPGRNYTTENYRFGFNGKEKDDEVKPEGKGNQQDYGMRIYDTRIAKFLSVDPISKKYPELTPYQFASNTPLWATDLDGLEAKYTTDGTFIGWGEIKGPDAPVILVITHTSIIPYNDDPSSNRNSVMTVQIPLTFNGNAVKFAQFEQYAAMAHNEAFGGTTKAKQKIADGIFNKRDQLAIDYPAFKGVKISLQTALDKVAYGNDSHQKRMSEERRNPPADAVIPGSKHPLSRITEKNYQDFILTDVEKRNNFEEMKRDNAVVIKGLLRDDGTRKEDTAEGKSHWSGNGSVNKFY